MATEDPKTVIVERSGGGMTAIIALIALVILAVGGYMLIESRSQKDDAISTAARQVGDAAQQAGDAAQEAAKKE